MSKTIPLILFLVPTTISAWAGEVSSFGVVMEHYEPIRIALIGDSMDGVSEQGRVISDELRALDADFSPGRAGVTDEAASVVRQGLGEMIAAADAIASAESLHAARDGLYALSKPMVRWREGLARNDRPSVAYCPMHKRSWLQPNEKIGNPYGGMPGCGSIVSK
jgi:hypothetical protein